MVIPAEAVEAAAKAMYAQDGGVGEFKLSVYEDYAAAMLEAAAPHMLAGAWDEGWLVGIDKCAGDLYGATNPYRPTSAD